MSTPGTRISVDEEPPYSFSDDLARGGLQGNLATVSSADGRTQDFARFCEQRQGNSQENGLPESNRDRGTSRQEAQQQHRYPIRGLVAVTPALHSHHQPDFAIAQSSTSSATPCHGTKAENGKPTHALIAGAPLGTLAPLPATSPFILQSQPESMEALEPFPADSPSVLRSQPEEKKVQECSLAKSASVLESRGDETMVLATPLGRDRYSHRGRGGCSTTPSSWQTSDVDGRAMASYPPDSRIDHDRRRDANRRSEVQQRNLIPPRW